MAERMPAPMTAPPPEPLPDETSDELLQRSRRVDWRFLLPDPTLGATVYFGQEESALHTALEDFTTSLVDGSTLGDSRAEPFDLAVLQNPPADLLPQVAALVRPGGYLYVELHRSMMRTAPWQLGRFTGTVARAGFGEVQTFWHWPDFERCTRILPLDDAIGLGSVVLSNQHGVVPWLKLTGVRIGHSLGLTGWAASSVSVIARRGEL